MYYMRYAAALLILPNLKFSNLPDSFQRPFIFALKGRFEQYILFFAFYSKKLEMSPNPHGIKKQRANRCSENLGACNDLLSISMHWILCNFSTLEESTNFRRKECSQLWTEATSISQHLRQGKTNEQFEPEKLIFERATVQRKLLKNNYSNSINSYKNLYKSVTSTNGYSSQIVPKLKRRDTLEKSRMNNFLRLRENARAIFCKRAHEHLET